ncbi:DegT/DnrJ/EryC1/StrS family aminotransferase [Klenkia taihuensis]|uniref:dTDP-4-amino-4,6-dideoxygalactose transaminase n=1 Tax=Klenkia taihuensis TaxID=1225127 RepID=A0A1I1MRK2_9ACTN|nr:DegT/DnrJ/EryC1/StrS family aminotransferase [Klenkia taihuensis]GHE14315.1 aminotransferase [Klenkia taihuensis]SFC85223.1 dTDP-4-amino-4,6-dideoxygalactose transaminase [Klenkia taihuensis]
MTSLLRTGPTVPFLDLRAQHTELRADLDAAALRVLHSDRLVLGPEVEGFEHAWAATAGARHAVGVASGLDALTLALRAVGVGPGDEVVVPAHTFVATWLSVVHVGAVPVPVDADPVSGAWDPAAVEAAVTPRTTALVPVHLYGHPLDLDPLLAVAGRHGLAVVDDAAQAHGARVGRRPVGSGARATAWSFYPGKNLGAVGDGGAVTTDDPQVAGRVRSLRNYGSTTKYRHDEVGWNSRLDELQAALLTVKLRHLEEWNARRRSVAARYDAALGGLPDLLLPATAPGTEPSWHLYVVRTPHRDALQAHLTACGVGTVVHYPVPPHRQPAFAGTAAAAADLPGADRWSAQVLSLPMGPHLTADHQDHVLRSVQEFRP